MAQRNRHYPKVAKTRIAPDPHVARNLAALMAATIGLETQPALARRAGVGQTTIGRILRGEVSPTAANLRKLAQALDADISDLYRAPASFAEWMKQRTSPPLATGEPAAPYVGLHQTRPLARVQRVPWEQLMSADLAQPFEVDVVDDALAPEITRGCVARFDPGRAPVAGRPVLVRDRSGAHYLRDYQVGASGRWQAVARARGYAPLDSEADGLTLVATMKGFDWP